MALITYLHPCSLPCNCKFSHSRWSLLPCHFSLGLTIWCTLTMHVDGSADVTFLSLAFHLAQLPLPWEELPLRSYFPPSLVLRICTCGREESLTFSKKPIPVVCATSAELFINSPVQISWSLSDLHISEKYYCCMSLIFYDYLLHNKSWLTYM